MKGGSLWSFNTLVAIDFTPPKRGGSSPINPHPLYTPMTHILPENKRSSQIVEV